MMTKEQFKAFWKEKTRGLSATQKRKMKIKHYNHYSWSAFTFCSKNPFKADDPHEWRVN